METELPVERKDLIALAKEQGWEVGRTEGGHLKFQSPLGKHVFGSGTPSDWRADQNLRMQLRRAGLKPVTEEIAKPALPEPKLVIDRSAPVVSTSTLVAKVEGGPSPVRQVVLEAMRRVNRGGGMKAEDILQHVQAKLPAQNKHQLGVHLANMCTTGYLTRVGPGKYTVVENHVPRVPGNPGVPKPRKKKKASAGTPAFAMPSPEDAQVLEQALAALAALEGLVKKYQSVGSALGGLQSMLGAFSTKGE